MKRQVLVLVALLFLAAPSLMSQSPPRFRTTEVTHSSIKVAWGALEGVSGYELYLDTIYFFTRDSVGEFRGLEPETWYSLMVRGRTMGGGITQSSGLMVQTLPRIGTGVDTEGVIPSTYGLEQNYPNPFNPETKIEYQLPISSHVRLSIYTVLGQEVRRLVDRSQVAAYHVVVWDGRDNAGNSLPSGVYFYRLESGNFQAMKKMMLMR